MAGTDRSRRAVAVADPKAPAVVLVEPQLGENIGAAARAMLNFGLTDMRLVAPRGDWPNQKAINTASGAEAVLGDARVFPSDGRGDRGHPPRLRHHRAGARHGEARADPARGGPEAARIP